MQHGRRENPLFRESRHIHHETRESNVFLIESSIGSPTWIPTSPTTAVAPAEPDEMTDTLQSEMIASQDARHGMMGEGEMTLGIETTPGENGIIATTGGHGVVVLNAKAVIVIGLAIVTGKTTFTAGDNPWGSLRRCFI
jgi:hypothetical protein